MNEQKRKYIVMWYDQDELKARDVIIAEDKEDAEKKAYLKYNGNPPGPLVSVMFHSLA